MKLFDDELLHEIRSRFHYVESDPIDGERIFLDSASGSLRLKTVTEAIAERSSWPDQLGRNSGGSRRVGEAMERGIDDVRLFLGARSGTIAPALSSTHAVFRVVNAALRGRPGGNVITTNIEHPCMSSAVHQLGAMYGQEVRVAPVDRTNGAVPVEAVLDRVDAETRLIGIVHGSNITGAVHDVKTIAREARTINDDVVVVTDGVQYAPHAPVDVEALGVDAYVFGPYKVFCVKGIGFAWLSDRIASLEHWSLAGKPADDWMLGCPAEATYAAWSAVVDYLCWLGGHFTDSTDRRARITAAMHASDAHLAALLHQLADGLCKTQLIGMDEDITHRVCLALFNVDGVNVYQGVEHFRRCGVRIHRRVSDVFSMAALKGLGVTEGMRASACHYNTPQDIDAFVQAVAALTQLSDDQINDLPSAPATTQAEG